MNDDNREAAVCIVCEHIFDAADPLAAVLCDRCCGDYTAVFVHREYTLPRPTQEWVVRQGAGTLDSRNPGLRGVEYAYALTAAEFEAWEKARKVDPFRNFGRSAA